MRRCGTITVLAMLVVCEPNTAIGQVAYPDHTIQNVWWSSGTHNTAVTQKIISPGSASQPVTISGTADAEFVSGTQVRLMPGFHAGDFTGNGQHFRARIDPNLGPDGDVVTIAPDPGTSVQDNIIHLPKWEKFEIGVRLPPEYQDAIDGFFAHYYSDGIYGNGGTSVATPDQVDQSHDLNPYADDSLLLQLNLTSPSGIQTVRWGYYMTEADWNNPGLNALLSEDINDPLHPYHVRFRLAPNEEGTWQYSLSIQAPHTMTQGGVPLAALNYTGYAFVCDPAESDNHGYLRVNPANNRTLQFEDNASFFGLGTNMPHKRSNDPGWQVEAYNMYRKDFNTMSTTMEDLHSVGGNFLRMFLMRQNFAPEWVNLGVYDHYKAVDPCNTNTGMPTLYGSCQFQCWAFDQMLDHARVNDIYVQLCIDPYPPIIDYENFIWGAHPYVGQFLEPERESSGRYDVERFFYTNADGDPTNKTDGVFYFWKRKYKYMMARWGYSVNIAAIEPFNEVNQLLTYSDRDLTNANTTNCPENRINWIADGELPATVSEWVSDIANFVRVELGHSEKLFLMSYTDGVPHTNTTHYLPFTNNDVALIDVHKGLGSIDAVNATFSEAKDFHETFNKPFHQGEYSSFGSKDFDGDPDNGAEYSTSGVFSNYDVSLHNEIWASTFLGNFTTGLSWAYERVFWWKNALTVPESDPGNPIPQPPFSNVLGHPHILNIGTPVVPIAVTVENRKVHHHFKPLTDMLSNLDWQSYDFFNNGFNAYRWIENGHGIECYYLMDTTHTLAIGWIHNRNAYWENNYYITNGDQNFLGCAAPWVDWHTIPGFQPGLDYQISWFPTRMNTSVCPDNDVDISGTGLVTLDFSSEPFGGVNNNYLDTLHSDYAFIVSIDPVVRGMNVASAIDGSGWDFNIYPNPANRNFDIQWSDATSKEIALFDLTGRQVQVLPVIDGRLAHVPIEHLASGVYGVRVTDGSTVKVKNLIVQ
jgi:hypothetical protein